MVPITKRRRKKLTVNRPKGLFTYGEYECESDNTKNGLIAFLRDYSHCDVAIEKKWLGYPYLQLLYVNVPLNENDIANKYSSALQLFTLKDHSHTAIVIPQ